MLLEDLNEIHKNKDLMAGSPAVGMESFNKMKSNESSPNQNAPSNID